MASIETEAVQNAVGAKRDGDLRLYPVGGPGFEQYRQIVLRGAIVKCCGLGVKKKVAYPAGERFNSH